MSVAFSGGADGAEVVGVLIKAVDAVRAVAIGEVEGAVAGVEGEVGGHEVLPPPVVCDAEVFPLGIASRWHGGALIPDYGSVEGEFCERVQAEIRGDIDELFCAFGSDFDSVSSALKLAAEGADEFSGRVKDEDAGVFFLFWVPFVHDVEVLLLVEGDVVGDLPGVFVWQYRPVMDDFVLMLPFAMDDGASGALCEEEVRGGERSAGKKGAFVEKGAAIWSVHGVEGVVFEGRLSRLGWDGCS